MNPWLVGAAVLLFLRSRTGGSAAPSGPDNRPWWVVAPISLQGVWVPAPEGVGVQMTPQEAAADQARRDATLATAEIAGGVGLGAAGLGLGTSVGGAAFGPAGALAGAAIGGGVGFTAGAVGAFGAQLVGDFQGFSDRGALLFV